MDLVSTYRPLALGGSTAFSFALNYAHTEIAEESELLTCGDVLGLERGVPRMRWNFAVDHGLGRMDLLGRLNYYGTWADHVDARYVGGVDAQLLEGRYVVDLAASIPIRRNLTLAVDATMYSIPGPSEWICLPTRLDCRTASSRRGV